jgi:hypothetical protein
MILASTKKTTRKYNSTNRRPAASRSASHRSVKSAPSFASFFLKLGVLLIVGLDILLTLNNFDRFFVLLGIELILSVLIGWVIFVIKDRIKDRN